MSHTRFDHVITVADLNKVMEFLAGPDPKAESRMFVEGEFVDTATGIPGSRGAEHSFGTPSRQSFDGEAVDHIGGDARGGEG